MTTRTCPSCARQAHSADDTSPWDCPYCGERIPVPTESHSAVIDAETRNSINFAIACMCSASLGNDRLSGKDKFRVLSHVTRLKRLLSPAQEGDAK